MNTVRSVLAASVIAAGFASPAVAQAADPVLAAVRAQVSAAVRADVAFTVETISNRGGSPERWLEAYDGLRPAGQRWTLIQKNGAAPDANERVDYPKRMVTKQPPTGLAQISAVMAAGAGTKLSESAGEVVYRFTEVPAGTLLEQGNDVSRHHDLEITVSVKGRPALTRAVFVAPQPFNASFVSVRESRTEYDYGLDARGFLVPERQAVVVKGSRPFGRVDVTHSRTFRDVSYRGPQTAQGR
jgi:hypothetical protein